MTRTSPAQVAFSSGEIAPLLRARFDYQRFQTGLAACRGFIPLLQGGVTRAPGTLHLGATADNQRARLIDFEFAANDTMILEFTPMRMRAWRYGELVRNSNGSIYEIATPYDQASLEKLTWVQSADVIWIADGIQPVQRLARYALNDWQLGPAPFQAGPFRVQNLSKNINLQASAADGDITLTASQALFEANHVGSLFHLAAEDLSNIPLWTGSAAISIGDMMRYDGRTYRLVSGNNTGVNPPLHREGTERVSRDPNVQWEFISDGFGVIKITSITSPTIAAATVIRALPPVVVTSSTYRWSEGAWSERYGYPAALELYEQRLVAGATRTDPRTIWFSGVGDFMDFEPGVEADSSFAYSISGGSSINRIQWIKSGRDGLHIGALGEEHSSIAPSRGQPISATNISFRFGSSYGSREHIQPVAPDGLPIFISKDGKRVIEISYSMENDSNIAVELSKPANHLGAHGFAEMIWLSAPQRQLWLRTDQGSLVVLVYDPSEEVLGWAPVPIADGSVESMAVTRDADGNRDVLTMVVSRLVNGQQQRFVEEQAITFGVQSEGRQIAEAVHLFCSKTFDLPDPSAEFSVPHLAGQDVYAWTDSGQFGPIPIAENGDLTLSSPVGRALIGMLDNTHHIRSLPFVPPTQTGSSLHRRKRLSPPFGIGLHKSAAAKAGIIETDFAQTDREWPMQNIIPRAVAADLTEAFTGIARVPLTSGYADELAVKIIPDGGAPLTITALVPTISEAGI